MITHGDHYEGGIKTRKPPFAVALVAFLFYGSQARRLDDLSEFELEKSLFRGKNMKGYWRQTKAFKIADFEGFHFSVDHTVQFSNHFVHDLKLRQDFGSFLENVKQPDRTIFEPLEFLLYSFTKISRTSKAYVLMGAQPGAGW
jgi:hypothetical protein